MNDKWAPNSTPCTPMWWSDWGCFNRPACPPCSWTVPPDLPQATAPMNPYYPFAPYAPPYPQWGFQDCSCAPPPPPYPVPYQMAANSPTPQGLYRRPCPALYVGHGSCCDECAVGKPCAGAAACCDACAAGQPCTCGAPKAVNPALLAAVAGGSHVGALYVSDAELDALGSQVALLDSDVHAASDKEYLSSDLAKLKAECIAAGFEWDDIGHRCLNLPDWIAGFGTPDLNKAVTGPIGQFLVNEWGPFHLSWTEYRDQTIHEPTRYDILRTQYLSLRTKWIDQLGQATKAEETPPLSESSGGNAIPWGWIALGVAIVAVPFVLPAVAGAYLALTKGRSLGLAA